MPIPEDNELDRERVEALIKAIGSPVNDFYRAHGGAKQMLVFEVLNGLACVTSLVIAGTAPHGLADCLEFFGLALREQINKTLEDFAEMAEKGGKTD